MAGSGARSLSAGFVGVCALAAALRPPARRRRRRRRYCCCAAPQSPLGARATTTVWSTHRRPPPPFLHTRTTISFEARAHACGVKVCAWVCATPRRSVPSLLYYTIQPCTRAHPPVCVCAHNIYIYIRVWVCVIHIYLAPPARQNSKFAPRPGKREIYRRYIVAGAAAVYVRVPAGEITRRGCATAYRARATSSCRRHRCCCCYYYCWSIPSAWDVRCVQCIEKSYIYMGLYMHIYI